MYSLLTKREVKTSMWPIFQGKDSTGQNPEIHPTWLRRTNPPQNCVLPVPGSPVPNVLFDMKKGYTPSTPFRQATMTKMYNVFCFQHLLKFLVRFSCSCLFRRGLGLRSLFGISVTPPNKQNKQRQ